MNETSKEAKKDKLDLIAEILGVPVLDMNPDAKISISHTNMLMGIWHSQQSATLQSRIIQLETEKAQEEGRIEKLEGALCEINRDIDVLDVCEVIEIIDKALNKT